MCFLIHLVASEDTNTLKEHEEENEEEKQIIVILVLLYFGRVADTSSD